MFKWCVTEAQCCYYYKLADFNDAASVSDGSSSVHLFSVSASSERLRVSTFFHDFIDWFYSYLIIWIQSFHFSDLICDVLFMRYVFEAYTVLRKKYIFIYISASVRFPEELSDCRICSLTLTDHLFLKLLIKSTHCPWDY